MSPCQKSEYSASLRSAREGGTPWNCSQNLLYQMEVEKSVKGLTLNTIIAEILNWIFCSILTWNVKSDGKCQTCTATEFFMKLFPQIFKINKIQNFQLIRRYLYHLTQFLNKMCTYSDTVERGGGQFECK